MTENIGEGALMAIKKQNLAIAEFKIPAAPKAKKRLMEILTEEQYIEVRSNKPLNLTLILLWPNS